VLGSEQKRTLTLVILSSIQRTRSSQSGAKANEFNLEAPRSGGQGVWLRHHEILNCSQQRVEPRLLPLDLCSQWKRSSRSSSKDADDDDDNNNNNNNRRTQMRV